MELSVLDLFNFSYIWSANPWPEEFEKLTLIGLTGKEELLTLGTSENIGVSSGIGIISISESYSTMILFFRNFCLHLKFNKMKKSYAIFIIIFDRFWLSGFTRKKLLYLTRNSGPELRTQIQQKVLKG